MKLIIAGTRTFTDYDYLCLMVEGNIDICEITEIVSGGARGVDALGERLAKELDIPLKLFPAEWEEYGKSAGYRRNAQMAEYADALLALWDGYSKGTSHMINLAEKHDLKVTKITVN